MGHIFDPDHLHAVARRSVGLKFTDMTAQVTADLAAAYPGAITADEDWIFNMAAGAVGSLKLLHASLTEYVILFGTPIGTQGFSGRYRIEIHDFMIEGEMWTYTDDNVGERIITHPGGRVVLPASRTKGYRLPGAAWMLEYGRGPIPTALPLGIADAVLSCCDLETAWKTLAAYSRLTLGQLRQGKR